MSTIVTKINSFIIDGTTEIAKGSAIVGYRLEGITITTDFPSQGIVAYDIDWSDSTGNGSAFASLAALKEFASVNFFKAGGGVGEGGAGLPDGFLDSNGKINKSYFPDATLTGDEFTNPESSDPVLSGGYTDGKIHMRLDFLQDFIEDTVGGNSTTITDTEMKTESELNTAYGDMPARFIVIAPDTGSGMAYYKIQPGNTSMWYAWTIGRVDAGSPPVDPGDETIERTMRLNFGSEYSGTPSNSPFYWNTLKPTNTQLSSASGFTSELLVTDDNQTTSITASNLTAFDAGVAEISNAQSVAGNTGLYVNQIVNTSWQFNPGLSPDASIRLAGLTSSKLYDLYVQIVSSGDNTDQSAVTVGATSVNKNTLNNFGVSGDSEFNSSMWVKIENVVPVAGNIDIKVKKNSGTAYFFQLASMIIRQKPSA